MLLRALKSPSTMKGVGSWSIRFTSWLTCSDSLGVIYKLHIVYSLSIFILMAIACSFILRAILLNGLLFLIKVNTPLLGRVPV